MDASDSPAGSLQIHPVYLFFLLTQNLFHVRPFHIESFRLDELCFGNTVVSVGKCLHIAIPILVGKNRSSRRRDVMYPRTALCVGRGFARLSSLAGSTHTLCPLSRGSLL